MKRITIFSPNYYTYGAMIVGGVLKEKFKNKYNINLVRSLNSNTINLFLKSEVVILSLYSTVHILDSNLKKAIEIIRNSTKNNKKIKIYVGGPVSSYPEIILNEMDVDGVILDEGEITVPNIIDGYEEGLAYLENGEIVINKPREKPELLSKPLIPKDIGNQSIRGANVYIETHRGCLGNCTFCQVPRFFGKKVRSKPLDLILEEVREFKKKGVKRIAISGGTGNLYNFKKDVNKSAFIEMLEKIGKIIGSKNLSVPDMRVDYVDEDTLRAIKKYTIGWVFYGLESGSDRILKSMKKGVNREKNLNGIYLAKEYNVKVGGSFIVGYPGEKDIDYLLTKDFIVDAELDDIFVSIAEPIPKTELCNLILNTPIEENLTFKAHLKTYRTFNLTESEARCFDLMLHGENWKSRPSVITKERYLLYLNEAKKQGEDIRNITKLIFKYKKYLL
ncbi:MAG TPA: TIGR04014 family B12-binding domain/radical SAM domain-containing protein [Methanothermococcus okinawensis]|uniref:TIGR04014 family B12-binding domain/radical SAM domain-containing protein n=1 Tax=Methanothermococcus okinawensis TaxID=155863 RepID=A0A832YSV6_9EURY|nr:TIGR04014 family B12-binding domain/radical SAM domain-containing protein [Methanothermococcus okinawensis]